MAHLVDAAVAAADVDVGVVVLVVADEQVVVHQLQVLQAGRVLHVHTQVTIKKPESDSPGVLHVVH